MFKSNPPYNIIEQQGGQCIEVIHPLIQHKLTLLRDKATTVPEFRRTLGELAGLLAFEVTRQLGTAPTTVETPLETTNGVKMARPVLLVPILRAGLGLLNPMLQVIPDAHVGFLGLKRDETTLAPISYYENIPKDLSTLDVIVLDPMLATGGSLVAALTTLAKLNPATLQVMTLLAAPEGISTVLKAHPTVTVYTASVDRELNKRGYILPGLGDAGDRIFNS